MSIFAHYSMRNGPFLIVSDRSYSNGVIVGYHYCVLDKIRVHIKPDISFIQSLCLEEPRFHALIQPKLAPQDLAIHVDILQNRAVAASYTIMYQEMRYVPTQKNWSFGDFGPSVLGLLEWFSRTSIVVEPDNMRTANKKSESPCHRVISWSLQGRQRK